MSKEFDTTFKELQEFVEQNKRMPKPQCRNNREEMLLGLWVFRTLQRCTVEEENKIRLLARLVGGTCPKPYSERVRELNKFVSERRRFESEGLKSLYVFYKRNIDKPEVKRLLAMMYVYKKGV